MESEFLLTYLIDRLERVALRNVEKVEHVDQLSSRITPCSKRTLSMQWAEPKYYGSIFQFPLLSRMPNYSPTSHKIELFSEIKSLLANWCMN
jgi:hypothetical protein